MEIKQPSVARARLHLNLTPLMWRDFALVLLLAIGLLLTMLVSAPALPLRALRIVLGLIFVLYVPGYCLTAALFPRADDLHPVERFGLNTGLSVALISLLALLANTLPWGIRPWPIFVIELSASALFAAIALWQRARLPAAARLVPSSPFQPRAWWQQRTPTERRLAGALSSAMLIAALVALWVFLVPSPDEYMTEFYMLGREGFAEQFPTEVVRDEQLRVTVGVVNREARAHSYRLELWTSDSYTSGRRIRVAAEDPLTLQPGEERRWPVAWRMPWVGPDQQVEFLLYRDDQSRPYRRLLLWTNVAERK